MKIDKNKFRRDSTIWSIADQVLVSGSNFLLAILIARFLGISSFGVYSIAQAYVLYSFSFQSAAVVSPMMTIVPGAEKSKRYGLICGFFGLSLFGVMTTALIVGFFASVLGFYFESLRLGDIIFPVLLTIATSQIQDWVRRSLYADSDNRMAFAADFFAYFLQVLLVGLLAWNLLLSVSAAFWVASVCFTISSGVVIYRKGWVPNWKSAKFIYINNWRHGRNLLLSSQLQWLGASGVVMFGAGMIGAQAAGAIRAAQSLLGPVNFILQWMDNVYPVRSANILSKHGYLGLVIYLKKIGLIGALIVLFFVLFLALFDEAIFSFVFGESFRPFAVLVVLQGVYFFFGFLFRIGSYYFRVLGASSVLTKSSFYWALVAIFSAWWCVSLFEESGVMYSLLAGEFAGLVFMVYAFVKNKENYLKISGIK